MDMAKKQKAVGKLKKLAMPKKRQGEQDLEDLDLGGEEPEQEQEDMLDLEQEQPDPLAEESEAMEGEEELSEDDAVEPSAAEGLSDEELLAELKKRGLEKKLSGEEQEQESEEDQEQYS